MISPSLLSAVPFVLCVACRSLLVYPVISHQRLSPAPLPLAHHALARRSSPYDGAITRPHHVRWPWLCSTKSRATLPRSEEFSEFPRPPGFSCGRTEAGPEAEATHASRAAGHQRRHSLP